jgi:ectoine hydroxylase-related dioxygenase (phytanoyl-CoA dioxygenase family)
MLNKYKENGFVILKSAIIDNNLKYFNEGFELLLKKECNDLGKTFSDYYNDGFMWLDKNNHSQIHKIYNILRNSDILSRIVFQENILSAIKVLMGKKDTESLYKTYHICRMDPPKDTTFLLNWHQESYSTIPHTNSIQMWCPLINRNDEKNGSIDILVGSHKKEIPHYLERLSDNYLSYSIPEKCIENFHDYNKITVGINPGDVLLFHPNLIHRSNNNYSSNVRYSLTTHFIDPHDKNFKLISDDEIIRLNRKRCVNAHDFLDEIEKDKLTYY